MTQQQIVKKLETYGNSIIKKHEPKAHKHLKPGTIPRMQAFLKELAEKPEDYSSDITKEANEILQQH